MDVIGRDDELRSLDASLDRPAAGGLAALVLEGEAGIGKSTLWLAGVEAARKRGLRVLSSRPAELEAGVAYAGLGDLLENALPEVGSELAEPRRRALEVALLVRDRADVPVDFRTLAVAVRSALDMLAEREPILVAIDDVQWLDASSTHALAFALRRLPGVNIRLLLARRIGKAIPVSELEHAVGDHVERLHVGPLSVGALHQLLQRRLGRVFARPTLLRLHETSGGNPFYALELARALGADADPTQPLPVPETLEALVRARLDRLPDGTREALLLACAHGRLPAAHLSEAALEPAFVDGAIELEDAAVRFTHPLLASVLYQHASLAARRRAHGQLVEMVDDPLARVRHRALAAPKPDAALACALDEATGVAIARGAAIAAAELGELALAATPANATEDRHRRALAAARAHLAAGEGARPRELAHELVARTPPGAARGEALALLSELVGLDRGVALLEEALAEAASDPRLQASLHQRLAGLGRLRHGRKWAERHARAAVALADRLDDDGLRAGALSMLALLRFDRGDPDAPRDAERAYELAVVGGDAEQEHEARSALGHVLTWSVDIERARDLYEAQYRKWHDRDERLGAEAHWYLSFVELRAGRWALAQRYAEHAREIGEQYGQLAPQHMFPLGLIAAHRGDLGRARELALRGTELADEEGALLGGLVSLLGIVEAWSGDPAAAVPWFAAAEQKADAADWGEPNHREWRDEYVEALLELGRVDEALALLDAWEVAAARVGRAWVLAQTARCRGLVAAARGDVEGALQTLEEAVAKHEDADDPFGRARALLALGVVRRRGRQKRPARQAIEQALAGFDALGAAGWAAKARLELGRIGGRVRLEGLTPAELRVAGLVVEGRTNREVASALFLGERTVASHLTHIYAKLGVRSRTELARKVQTF